VESVQNKEQLTVTQVSSDSYQVEQLSRESNIYVIGRVTIAKKLHWHQEQEAAVFVGLRMAWAQCGKEKGERGGRAISWWACSRIQKGMGGDTQSGKEPNWEITRFPGTTHLSHVWLLLDTGTWIQKPSQPQNTVWPENPR
jgi:hypothetical protein